MRPLRNPVTQFLLAGLLTVAFIFVGINYLAGRAASDEAISEARTTNDILARLLVQPKVRSFLTNPDARGGLDRFDRTMKYRLVGLDEVDQVVIWDRRGTVLYSTNLRLIGTRPGLNAEQRRVLRDGGTGSQVADAPDSTGRAVSAVENREHAGSSQPQVRIYTRITGRSDEPLLFESYYSLRDIERRREDLYRSFRWITLGPLVLLILVVTVILSLLSRQLTRASHERERLLRSAMDASDAERRRIARDLHDGVVQDLAGTAFSVTAVARHPGTAGEARETLESAGLALRTSLKSLRSLLAEIHPPELHAEGLASALEDLIAPAGAAGIQASVSVQGTEAMSDERAALVWRVAQEAVRNAIRHSSASTVAVTVRCDGVRTWLEVVDDGVGFDPRAARDPHRYGLRGLRSLVGDVGGKLQVRSSPGEGTSVRLEVDAR